MKTTLLLPMLKKRFKRVFRGYELNEYAIQLGLRKEKRGVVACYYWTNKNINDLITLIDGKNN